MLFHLIKLSIGSSCCWNSPSLPSSSLSVNKDVRKLLKHSATHSCPSGWRTSAIVVQAMVIEPTDVCDRLVPRHGEYSVVVLDDFLPKIFVLLVSLFLELCLFLMLLSFLFCLLLIFLFQSSFNSSFFSFLLSFSSCHSAGFSSSISSSAPAILST